MSTTVHITPPWKRRVVLAAWIFVAWTVIAVLFALQWYTYDSFHGTVLPWDHYLRWAVEEWYTWAALTPLVVWLATHRPIRPHRIWKTLPLHIAASILFTGVATFIQAMFTWLLNDNHWTLIRYVGLYLTKDVAINIATYWAVTGFAQTLSYYREAGKREVRESQLEKQLAQAQLQVLQMQLHPHFLFNSLHAIGTLIQDEPESAEQMLLDLGSLLRVFLEGQASQEITLQRELDLVNLYMGIQQVRFRDRLKVTSLVAPEALSCSVPSLLLQPIVENAIVHGIAKNPGRDTIEINASVDGTDLVIEVTNHNSSLSRDVNSDGSGFRLGLSNARQRLGQMYGETARIGLASRKPHGVICRITFPARRLNIAAQAVEEAMAL
jgi:two-component system, LytTR family, sensor kinase